MTRVIDMINNDAKETREPDLEPFNRIRAQLSVVKGVLCKGTKIVVPPSLQSKAVTLSHKTHQGIAKSKAFARSFCWFPGIDDQITQKVKKCHQCQAVQDTNLEQPIKPR